MMDPNTQALMKDHRLARKLARLSRWVLSRLPLIGWLLRLLAIRGLCAHRQEPGAQEGLVKAVGSPQPKVAARAEAALRTLTSPEAIDALCGLWAEGRDDALGSIIAERGYVARKPADLRILCMLKCGRDFEPKTEPDLDVLARLLGDPDPSVKPGAASALEKLPSGPLRDALCGLALRDPRGAAAQLCVKRGFWPRDEERAALFLFVTRQLDAYFQEDDGFEMLRREYDRADPAVQGQVMEVVRSGDRRCLGFFGARKKLSECSDQEIRVALESAISHQDWPRLWRAFSDLPLRHGMPVIPHFKSSGWAPRGAREASLFKEVTALGSDGAFALPAAEARRPRAESSAFAAWLGRGAAPQVASLDPDTILARLAQAPPPEGVALVAALAAKGAVDSKTWSTIEKHPHWPVRLAGHAVTRNLLASDRVEDPVHWVRELVDAKDVLELWPAKATPADLEALEAAPAEAWTGKLGTPRRLLRALMAHRMVTGAWEEVVVEAGEFAGEFEEAGGEFV